MKKKLASFIYPIIAACICFVVGIVLFSVALALKWGTAVAVLQLYTGLVLAALCAVLSVVLKFYPIDDKKAEEPTPNAEFERLLRELREEVDAANRMLQEIHKAMFGATSVKEAEDEDL